MIILFVADVQRSVPDTIWSGDVHLLPDARQREAKTCRGSRVAGHYRAVLQDWAHRKVRLSVSVLILVEPRQLVGRAPPPPPCSGELWTQKLKSHLVRTQSLNVLPLKTGVGRYIAIHATLTARDFSLAYFYPSGPFTCIVFQNFSRFFLCLLWLTHGFCEGPQNKIGHPAGERFPCWVSMEYKQAQKHDLWCDDLRNE